MGDDSGAIDQIAFLTRSKPRVRILTHLLESGPATQRELRERIDTSRSTVTRSLSALTERAWLTEDGDRYRLTPSGRIVADGLAELLDTVQATDELATFIEWFPYGEYDLDLDHLRDAEITASTDPDPYAPSRKHAAAVREASSFRALLPSVDLQLVRGLEDRVLGGELDAEWLVSQGLEETISTGEFAETLHEQISAGGLTVRVCDRPAPFYLGLSDTGLVQIGVEDDEGFPRALLETDSAAIRTWAESVYADFRKHSREKPAAEF